MWAIEIFAITSAIFHFATYCTNAIFSQCCLFCNIFSIHSHACAKNHPGINTTSQISQNIAFTIYQEIENLRDKSIATHTAILCVSLQECRFLIKLKKFSVLQVTSSQNKSSLTCLESNNGMASISNVIWNLLI